MKDACRGFSLTEMVVVIGILVLLLAAVLPALGPMRRHNSLRVGATTVAGSLRSARSLAIARSMPCYVYANDLSGVDEMLIYQTSPTIADRTDKLPEGIDIKSITPASKIVFDPDGSARSISKIIVQDRTGAARSVTVTPVSGRVSLSAETE